MFLPLPDSYKSHITKKITSPFLSTQDSLLTTHDSLLLALHDQANGESILLMNHK